MYQSFIKTIFDRVMALVLLLLVAPLLLFLALIAIFTGRSFIFTQRRPGLHGKHFTIYKLQTMTQEKDTLGNLLSDEKRLDSYGRLLRSLSLDELPQLINILKGEMSFIGPRPLLPEYLRLYSPSQQKRHNVLPGITGWAQINGRNTISWGEKFELDVYYVNNISFWLDMKIIGLTILKVLRRDGVSAQNHVTVEKFNGSN